MKFRSLDWQKISDSTRHICCPICEEVWLVDNENGPHDITPCKHLRFFWLSATGDIQIFGDWDTDQFLKDYEKAYDIVYGSVDLEEISLHAVDPDVLKEIETAEIDEVFDNTESGVACGPVSVTTLWGIKR